MSGTLVRETCPPLRIDVLLGYNSRAYLRNDTITRRGSNTQMNAAKLEHFRKILTEQLRHRTENVRDNQAAALEMGASDDGVKDAVDMSLKDVNQEIALRLGERESQMVADIDQALFRIDEGSYGICARCEKTISERRLEALPTARYCAECQSAIEAASGEDDISTL
ncbi:hypothetical protein BH18ACI2_BH18ACI2_25680 [soil metagenome]